MTRYFINRVLTMIPVLLGVTLFTFALLRFIPGDPIQVMLGTEVQGNRAEELRELYGLNRPWPVQYVEWLGRAVRGNLGTSLRSDRPVTQSIMEFLPVTIELTALSLLLGMLIGLPLGILAAQRRGTPLDSLLTSISLLGISIPNFWLATLMTLTFSLSFRLLPSIGYTPLQEDPIDNLKHLIMPALALGLPLGATIMRFARSALLEVFGQDYVRTARAKGLNRFQVVVGHALRNALIPVITIAGIQVGRLLGGAVIVEQIFALPGLGRYTYDAIQMRDYPVVQGTVLVFTIVFLLVNLLVDVLYGFVDPRIKLAGDGPQRKAT